MTEGGAALDKEARRLLAQASTATLTTQLFKRGFRNTFLKGLRPLDAKAAGFVAEAFTLRYIPAREDLDTLAALGDPDHPQRRAVETVPAGHALVMDCRGDLRAGSVGAILAKRMQVRGVAAIVTDGSVRDAPEIAGFGFPVFCAAPAAPPNVTIHHAADFQTPIACAGVAVFPGDVLVGDAEGVVVVPRHLAREVAADAAEQENLERFIMDKVAAGASIRGVYPPDEATMEEYRRWVAGQGG